MKLTGAAILVSRDMKVLQAAPAAYPYRSVCTTNTEGVLMRSGNSRTFIKSAVAFDDSGNPHELLFYAELTPSQSADGTPIMIPTQQFHITTADGESASLIDKGRFQINITSNPIIVTIRDAL